MKKTLCSIVILFLLISTAFSQSGSSRSIEWDIFRLGPSVTSLNDTLAAGIYFGTELRFNFIDKYSIGISADYNFNGKELTDSKENETNWSRALSILVDRKFGRLFLGTGLGVYKYGITKSGPGDELIKTSGISSTGASFRAGFKVWHIRVLFQYQLGFKKGAYDNLNLSIAISI